MKDKEMKISQLIDEVGCRRTELTALAIFATMCKISLLTDQLMTAEI